MEKITEDSPRPNARTIGVIYLLYFLTAFFSIFLTKGLVLPSDAATTSNHLLAHEALYRAGSMVDLIANVIYIAVIALFYGLFERVNRTISLLAAFFSLVGCAIQIFSGVFRVAPFLILGNNQLSNVFTVEQLQQAALLSLMLRAEAVKIALILFAFYDLLLGYLIFRSTFLPHVLGVLLMFASVGWLTFVWMPFLTTLSSFILFIGGLAEILLMLWLLLKGVNISKS